MSKTYNSDLQTLNVNLQAILNTIDNLPEASNGVELPELDNEAAISEIFEGKEVIDGEGNKIVGTFTIDSEVSTQTDLITQIATALEGKAAGGVELPALTNPVTSDKILQGYDAIDDGGNRIVGTIPNTEVDYYECYVDETTGLVSPLMAINYGGYVPDNYIFNFTHQLPTQEGTTITPTSEEQVVVAAGTYCTGDIKVAAASGGGGGSGVETCTVYASSDSYGGINHVVYTSIDTNNSIITNVASTSAYDVIAVCNTHITIYNSNGQDYADQNTWDFICTGCELIYKGKGVAIAKITASANDEVWFRAIGLG